MNIKRANDHNSPVKCLASNLKETSKANMLKLPLLFVPSTVFSMPAMVSSVATGTAVLGVQEHRGRHALRVLLGWADSKGMITLFNVRTPSILL